MTGFKHHLRPATALKNTRRETHNTEGMEVTGSHAPALRIRGMLGGTVCKWLLGLTDSHCSSPAMQYDMCKV